MVLPAVAIGPVVGPSHLPARSVAAATRALASAISSARAAAVMDTAEAVSKARAATPRMKCMVMCFLFR